MLIVHLSNTPVAGAPLAIAQAISRHTDHSSVAIHRSHSRWEPTWRIDRDFGRSKWFLMNADVIHCHGNFSLHHPGRHREFCEFARKNMKKGCRLVWQAHASPKECPDAKWFYSKECPYRLAVVAQGWERHWPDAADHMTFVRNPIDLGAVEMTPMPWHKRDPVICFNPSNRFCSDRRFGKLNRPEKTNPKGWEFVRWQLRHLPLRTIEDLPYVENLVAKGDAYLGVDDVVTPMWHRSGLEFLAKGVYCVQYMDDASMGVLLQVSGADEVPFLVLRSPEELVAMVEDVWDDPDALRVLGEDSGAWMARHWREADIAREYLALYGVSE